MTGVMAAENYAFNQWSTIYSNKYSHINHLTEIILLNITAFIVLYIKQMTVSIHRSIAT